MVTGAYAPEFSAGGLQSRAIAQRLHDRVNFEVLTTATNPDLPATERIDGITVNRVHIDPRSRWSRAAAAARLFHALGSLVPAADLIHVQGYSSKNIPVAAMARAFGRPVILHLQTARHDEPPAIQAQGRSAWRAFSTADRFIAVSPALKAAAVSGGIAAGTIDVVPNGVDTTRFAPADPESVASLRGALGVAGDRPMILYVGVVMPDKQPHVLFEAWSRLQGDPATQSTLVFVGATNPHLYELGDRLADRLRAEATRLGLEDRVMFVEPTHAIESFFRAADVFVMPTVREGCPNVLLEAMACALPAVASRLPGATDAIVTDGVDGRLVEVGDVDAFARAIVDVLTDRSTARAMGRAARQTVEQRFAIEHVAGQWLQIYEETLASR